MSTVIGQITGGLHFSVARTRGGRLLVTRHTAGYLTEKQPGSLSGVED